MSDDEDDEPVLYDADGTPLYRQRRPAGFRRPEPEGREPAPQIEPPPPSDDAPRA